MLDRTLNTIFFESLSHTNTLLNGLNELRLKGEIGGLNIFFANLKYRGPEPNKAI